MKKLVKVFTFILLISAVALFIPIAVIMQLALKGLLDLSEAEGAESLSQFINPQVALVTLIIAIVVTGLGLVCLILWIVFAVKDKNKKQHGEGGRKAARIIGIISAAIGVLTLGTGFFAFKNDGNYLPLIIGGSFLGIGIILIIVSLIKIKVVEPYKINYYPREYDGDYVYFSCYPDKIPGYMAILYTEGYDEFAAIELPDEEDDRISIALATYASKKELKQQFNALAKGTNKFVLPVYDESDFTYQEIDVTKNAPTRRKKAYVGKRPFVYSNGSGTQFFKIEDGEDGAYYENIQTVSGTYGLAFKGELLVNDSGEKITYKVTGQAKVLGTEPVFEEEKTDDNRIYYHGYGSHCVNCVYPHAFLGSTNINRPINKEFEDARYRLPMELRPQNDVDNIGMSFCEKLLLEILRFEEAYEEFEVIGAGILEEKPIPGTDQVYWGYVKDKPFLIFLRMPDDTVYIALSKSPHPFMHKKTIHNFEDAYQELQKQKEEYGDSASPVVKYGIHDGIYWVTKTNDISFHEGFNYEYCKKLVQETFNNPRFPKSVIDFVTKHIDNDFEKKWFIKHIEENFTPVKYK